MTAGVSVSPATLKQITDVIFDLQSADYNNFDKHIKKLSRLLHSPELGSITKRLTAGIDLDGWIEAGLRTRGGMAGSAKLDWPDEVEKELGTAILLIDRFAEKGSHDALNFAHEFYYAGNNLSSNLRSLTTQLIVPFARDYIGYVKAVTGADVASAQPTRPDSISEKIFIVHGHDEGAREMVARYLQKLGLEPIILHEQASRGNTLIEKISAHSDVGFAVVLLTPDDIGAARGQEAALQGRARQNVLLELGYFVGKLGRERVCALKRGDVEVPSDFGGVVFVPFDDSGGWRSALGRELEAAGFAIDWNLVMRS